VDSTKFQDPVTKSVVGDAFVKTVLFLMLPNMFRNEQNNHIQVRDSISKRSEYEAGVPHTLPRRSLTLLLIAGARSSYKPEGRGFDSR
jgi:hypothetical protein